MSGAIGGGKKYGLILAKRPDDKAKKLAAVKAISASFEADADDDVEADIARQAHKKKSQRELAEQHAKALAEDPSVFDYDGVYDEMQSAKAQAKAAQIGRRESKYIGALMEKAKERERERDIIHERQLAKEREAEEHKFGDKEQFVTAAYKRKLAEQAKWLAEEKQREAREAAEEVTKKGDLSDFYRNLLTGNVAFGGKAGAPSNPTASTAAPPGGSGKPGDTVGAVKAVEAIARADGPSHPAAGEGHEGEGRSNGGEAPAAPAVSGLVPQRVGTEGVRSGDGEPSASREVEGERSPRLLLPRESERAGSVALAGERGGSKLKDREGSKASVPGPQGLAAEEREKRKAEAGEGVREDAIASARERYLARKKAKS